MKSKNILISVFIFALIMLVGALVTNLHSQSANDNSNQLTLGSNSLNFLVISDWGREGINDTDEKTPGQLKVAKQFGVTAEEINASFVVTCGDNFHGKGVPSSTDSLWKVNFEDVYTAKSLMIPWYITLGNHDNEGNVNAELEYAKTSNRWIQPARYYSFTKKLPDSSNVLFVIVDSSPFIQEYLNEKDGHHLKDQNPLKQLQWCDSVLSGSVAKWKFVFFHHPAYSASFTHGSTHEIQNYFIPMFQKYKVDACFSGHDHDLQHSHSKNSTIDYFGVGGGSEARSAVGHAEFTKYINPSLGFGVVSLTENNMRFSFVNDKGESVYAYEIHK